MGSLGAMAARRSHVSSGSENDDETRRLDRATSAIFGRGAGTQLSPFFHGGAYPSHDLQRGVGLGFPSGM